MKQNEFEDIISVLRGYFPRMLLTGHWAELWWKFLRGYSSDIATEAVVAYCNENTIPPTIGRLRGIIIDILRQRKYSETSNKPIPYVDSKEVLEFRNVSRIEFCMDVLGASTVTEEIRKIVSIDPNGFKWSSLFDDPQWVSKYREKLDEMFEAAKQFNPSGYQNRFFYKGIALEYDKCPIYQKAMIDRKRETML